jgi:hypothetical protein
MADETTNDTTVDADASRTAAAPKKTRQPRKSKNADTQTSAVAAPVKKTRAKRGTKTIQAKTAKPADRQTTEPKPAAAVAATEGTMSSDGFADLIALEEENKSLRKQLSEKLRAENADLRKRLGQG